MGPFSYNSKVDEDCGSRQGCCERMDYRQDVAKNDVKHQEREGVLCWNDSNT